MMYIDSGCTLARLSARWSAALVCLFLAAQPVLAQVVDTEPPEVGFDTVDETRKGDSQVFTVTATDNQNIETLVIFYRLGPDTEYQSGSMERIGETDLYTFIIRANAIPESVDVIEYYLEAKDDSGNRTLQGFSFDPIVRSLVERPAVSNTTTNNEARPEETVTVESSESMSTARKIVYGVLGVVVVGALVSAAGSDGDSGSRGPTTQLTIVTPPLDVAR